MAADALTRIGARARGGSPLWQSAETAGVVLRTEWLGPTYTFVAEASPFDLRGGAAVLKYELATAGSAGAAAPLPSLSTLLEPTTVGYTLTAEAGTFALAGQAATLLRGALVSGGAGAFSIAGQAATTKAGKRLAGDPASFALAGQDATLFKPGAYTLAAEAAAFALSGVDAALTYAQPQPEALSGGGAMFSLPPVRKRRPLPEPEWDEEADDAGVLVAVGIL